MRTLQEALPITDIVRSSISDIALKSNMLTNNIRYPSLVVRKTLPRPLWSISLRVWPQPTPQSDGANHAASKVHRHGARRLCGFAHDCLDRSRTKHTQDHGTFTLHDWLIQWDSKGTKRRAPWRCCFVAACLASLNRSVHCHRTPESKTKRRYIMPFDRIKLKSGQRAVRTRVSLLKRSFRVGIRIV